MHAQAQTRQIIAMLSRDPGAHGVRLNTIRFEHH
jgi:hypothetical protein